jgi:hypothetical protein
VKLATGNRGRQPLPVGEPMPEGDPVMPTYLAGREVQLWADLVRVAFWLREPDSYKMAAWCRLQADFADHWREWLPGTWHQWRTLGCELGLDPASRAKIGMVPRKRPEAKADPANKYFRIVS